MNDEQTVASDVEQPIVPLPEATDALETSKNLGGRPLKFPDVKTLQDAVDAYFAECDPHLVEEVAWLDARDPSGKLLKDKYGQNYLIETPRKRMTEQKPYLITGLALALGTTRETLLDYEDRDGFSDTIKKAKLKCQSFTESQLHGPTPTGSIFSLKNNYGWKDKTEVDADIHGNMTVETTNYAGAVPDAFGGKKSDVSNDDEDTPTV